MIEIKKKRIVRVCHKFCISFRLLCVCVTAYLPCTSYHSMINLHSTHNLFIVSFFSIHYSRYIWNSYLKLFFWWDIFFGSCHFHFGYLHCMVPLTGLQYQNPQPYFKCLFYLFSSNQKCVLSMFCSHCCHCLGVSPFSPVYKKLQRRRFTHDTNTHKQQKKKLRFFFAGQKSLKSMLSTFYWANVFRINSEIGNYDTNETESKRITFVFFFFLFYS